MNLAKSNKEQAPARRPHAAVNGPSCEDFIRHLSISAEQPLLVLMATKIYLRRLKRAPKLDSGGLFETPNQLFLGVLRLAVKYLDDRIHTKKYWRQRARLTWAGTSFSINSTELDSVESTLLLKLRWSVSFGEEELLDAFKSHIPSPRRIDEAHEQALSSNRKGLVCLRLSGRGLPSRKMKTPRRLPGDALPRYIKRLQELATTTERAMGNGGRPTRSSLMGIKYRREPYVLPSDEELITESS